MHCAGTGSLKAASGGPGTEARIQPLIHFDDLSKTFYETYAVRSLTFRVEAGEIGALLGPNGAGKTTALRCLATLLEPTSGTARVAGKDVRLEPQAVRARLGFMEAKMGLYARLTPPELLRFFGAMHSLRGRALQARVDELMEAFDIRPFADTYCGQLSEGQRQRVAIARALVQDPPVLVLDEPTTGLDLVSAEVLHTFLVREKERGKAILLSTHDMTEVELLADHVGVITEGRLVADGTPAQIVEQAGATGLAQAFMMLVRAA